MSQDETTFSELCPSTGGAILVRAILAGVIIGTTANVSALWAGYGIWIGLLCHSVFGASAMAMMLLINHFGFAGKEPDVSSTPRRSQIETVQN